MARATKMKGEDEGKIFEKQNPFWNLESDLSQENDFKE